MNSQTFVNQQAEEQIIDQYLSGDTACRVFATLEYYTYRSIQKPVPGIFAKYTGKNNSGVTKSLEQLKRQLKTHVLSFLSSHQDMVNNYGIYPYPNNFSEKDTKNFIRTCQSIVKDPEVKMYCEHLLDIIKKDYQKVIKYYQSLKKDKKPEMDPQTQINKFMPAIGESAYNQEKAAKMAREGKYVHNVDINEKAKKRALIQGHFINCLNTLNSYISGYLGEYEIHSELEEFFNEFKSNDLFFQFPRGYEENKVSALITDWSKKDRNSKFYCQLFMLILQKNYEKAANYLYH